MEVSYETLTCAPSAWIASRARGLGRARVRRGQDAERPAARAVGAQRFEQRGDAAAADERHDDVDAVRRVDLGAELACRRWARPARSSAEWCRGAGRAVRGCSRRTVRLPGADRRGVPGPARPAVRSGVRALTHGPSNCWMSFRASAMRRRHARRRQWPRWHAERRGSGAGRCDRRPRPREVGGSGLEALLQAREGPPRGPP